MQNCGWTWWIGREWQVTWLWRNGHMLAWIWMLNIESQQRRFVIYLYIPYTHWKQHYLYFSVFLQNVMFIFVMPESESSEYMWKCAWTRKSSTWLIWFLINVENGCLPHLFQSDFIIFSVCNVKEWMYFHFMEENAGNEQYLSCSL